jgi:hypothetical protein
MPSDETRPLHKLEEDVEEELIIARDSHPEEEIDLSPAQWQFDPLDEERYEIGLRSILGAIEARHDDGERGHPSE